MFNEICQISWLQVIIVKSSTGNHTQNGILNRSSFINNNNYNVLKLTNSTVSAAVKKTLLPFRRHFRIFTI